MVHTKLPFGSFCSINKNKSVHTTPNIYVAQTKLENSYMSGYPRSQIMFRKNKKVTLNIRQNGKISSTRP